MATVPEPEKIRGELAIGHGYRATNLYAVGPVTTSTMMQSCASAAKLQDDGSILDCGSRTNVAQRVAVTSDSHL
jgi:hypothetical protein